MHWQDNQLTELNFNSVPLPSNNALEADALQRASLQRLRIFACGKPAITRGSTRRYVSREILS